jgi:hypothetical protein
MFLTRRLEFSETSDDESPDHSSKSSPGHTRSGRVYHAERQLTGRQLRARLLLKERVEDGDVADWEETDEDFCTMDNMR